MYSAVVYKALQQKVSAQAAYGKGPNFKVLELNLVNPKPRL